MHHYAYQALSFIDLFSFCSQMMNYGRYEDGAEYADFSGKSVQIRIVISGQNGVQMKKKHVEERNLECILILMCKSCFLCISFICMLYLFVYD